MTSWAQTAQPAKPEAKPRTLTAKVSYTGAGTVDEKHKIFLFLFDNPDFRNGGVAPIAVKTMSSKSESLTFTEVSASPVYLAAIYDPKGEYQGMDMPPSGASVAIYGMTPDGEIGAIKIEPGQTVKIEMTFDDSTKMP